ncbi:MAG: hypothetical protein MI976_00130 [Pseudomonadales bacterium]|nr:hypothetical protein [Pseudomonadales bacterium]
MLTTQFWFGSDNLEHFGNRLQIENDRGINATTDFSSLKLRAVYNLKDIYSVSSNETNSLKYLGFGGHG